jgi:SRSO17 transposase
MQYNQEYQKEIVPQYVKSILTCRERKTCTNLANVANTSHDRIYKDLEEYIESQQTIKDIENLALKHLSQNKIIAILDDSRNSKLYAKEIEGLDVGFDGSTKTITQGFTIVNALLTDENINIPINCMQYVKKELAQDSYMTKSEIAMVIIAELIKTFTLQRVLADAHYATETVFKFLCSLLISFLMKMPRNRKVTVDGKTDQLQNILKLKKNQRTAYIKAEIYGLSLYFYVIKLKDKSTIYFVSNDLLDPYEVYRIYKIRWNIEIFHRVAKQHLGLGDCQMRSSEKQRQHVLYVMHAYALASIYKHIWAFDCVENVINHLRIAKLKHLYGQNQLSDRTLC